MVHFVRVNFDQNIECGSLNKNGPLGSYVWLFIS